VVGVGLDPQSPESPGSPRRRRVPEASRASSLRIGTQLARPGPPHLAGAQDPLAAGRPPLRRV